MFLKLFHYGISYILRMNILILMSDTLSILLLYIEYPLKNIL